MWDGEYLLDVGGCAVRLEGVHGPRVERLASAVKRGAEAQPVPARPQQHRTGNGDDVPVNVYSLPLTTGSRDISVRKDIPSSPPLKKLRGLVN